MWGAVDGVDRALIEGVERRELPCARVIQDEASVLWYEQHVSPKNLEPLIEELDCRAQDRPRWR
jgi:hypothetical protein